MRKIAVSCLFGCAIALTACGSGAEDTQPAASSDSAEVSAPTAQAEAASSGPDKGQIAFLRCRSCHAVKEGDGHLVGPNLHGLIGAVAGQKEGFAFSSQLARGSDRVP
jgi:cytochrome c